jgi:hypothetical protein
LLCRSRPAAAVEEEEAAAADAVKEDAADAVKEDADAVPPRRRAAAGCAARRPADDGGGGGSPSFCPLLPSLISSIPTPCSKLFLLLPTPACV